MALANRDAGGVLCFRTASPTTAKSQTTHIFDMSAAAAVAVAYAGIKRTYSEALGHREAKVAIYKERLADLRRKHELELEDLRRELEPAPLAGERHFRILEALLRGERLLLHKYTPLLSLLTDLRAVSPANAEAQELLEEVFESYARRDRSVVTITAAAALSALREFLPPAADGGIDLPDAELLALAREILDRRYIVEWYAVKWPYDGHPKDGEPKPIEVEFNLDVTLIAGTPLVPQATKAAPPQLDVQFDAFFDSDEAEDVRDSAELCRSSEWWYEGGLVHALGDSECVLVKVAAAQEKSAMPPERAGRAC